MKSDDASRALEEAEKAARDLKRELQRARALVDRTRERMERELSRQSPPESDKPKD
jgi:exonuclease VII small subunit